MVFSFTFQGDGLDISDLLVFLKGKMELCIIRIKLFFFFFLLEERCLLNAGEVKVDSVEAFTVIHT